jgi:hypothetical protein
MSDPLANARDALLTFRADAKKWEEDVDGDADDDGRPRCTIHYNICVDAHTLRELVEAVGIDIGYRETPGDAIERALDPEAYAAEKAAEHDEFNRMMNE